MDARDALTRWQRDGLISEELASVLRSTLDDEERSERSGAVIRVLVGVGAILIGGGMMLFIGSHWDSQSPVRRFALLLAAYGVIVAAAALADARRLPTTARALWFVSSIAVGVNVFLIGQVFNLPLNYWQGTLVWMVAALAMAWASPSVAHGWLVVVLGILTLGWMSVPSARFYDQAAFLWDAGGIRPLLPLVGLAATAGATVADGTDFAFLERPARVIGVLLIAVPMTVSTFHPTLFAWVWEIDARWFHLWVVIAVLGVVGACWWFGKQRLLAWSFAVLAVLEVVLLIQVVPGEDAPSSIDELSSTSWLARPLAESELVFGSYTALVFVLALAAVFAGQRLRIAALVNVGIAVIAVLTMAVYIGRVAGALPTSLAVLIGGILLVAIAVVFERKRRDLLSDTAGPEAAS
jgi:uncharacterized membrane protein